MGSAYEFKCEKCGYTVVSSVGKDCGFEAVVQPMICRSCNIVVSVLIGKHLEEGPTGIEFYDKKMGICPECGGKDLFAWDEARPCPKCGARMTMGELRYLWD